MKKIIAIGGVGILALLYILTLIAAIFDSTATLEFFRASAAATIIIPVMLYIYLAYYKYKHRDEIALKEILDKDKASKANSDNTHTDDNDMGTN